MPRRRRSYLPGAAFHITARTHCGEFWFEDLRSEIEGIVATALRLTDAILIAYAIMTNHLHLVVRQGKAPLSQLMHPVGQRTAYAVHRRLKRKGYVLGYRYADTPCMDDAHLRNAIMYVHRNPVAANMCGAAPDYPWSSARAYHKASASAMRIAGLTPALGLFASGLPDRTEQQDYTDFYTWYDTSKMLGPDDPRPYSPGVTAGDEYWMQNFDVPHILEAGRRSDLRDLVRRSLAELGPDLRLTDIRACDRRQPTARIRNVIIERALLSGHRPVEIARVLGTSDSTVSRIRSARSAWPNP